MNALLRARLAPGLFPNERIVEVPTFDGSGADFFADELRCGRGSFGDGVVHEFVMVEIVERSDIAALVRLPGESFTHGRFVKVYLQDLLPTMEP